MAPKPLNILKNGLDKFSKKIKTRKEALTLKLSRRESISSADENWLDQEANTIDAEPNSPRRAQGIIDHPQIYRGSE